MIILFIPAPNEAECTRHRSEPPIKSCLPPRNLLITTTSNTARVFHHLCRVWPLVHLGKLQWGIASLVQHTNIHITHA